MTTIVRLAILDALDACRSKGLYWPDADTIEYFVEAAVIQRDDAIEADFNLLISLGATYQEASHWAAMRRKKETVTQAQTYFARLMDRLVIKNEKESST